MPGARHIVVLCPIRASRNTVTSDQVVGAQTLGLDVHRPERRAPLDGLCSGTRNMKRRETVGEGPGPRLSPRMAL